MNTLKTFFLIIGGFFLLVTLLILWPFWILFSIFVNRLENSTWRRRGKEIQLPVVKYQHQKTGNKVLLFGVMHIAEPEFYRAIEEHIRARPRYRVLFEGVGRLSPAEEKSLTPKEQSVQKEFDTVFKLVDQTCKALGLIHQRESITYQDTWINTDVTMYHIVQTFAKENLNLMRAVDRLEKLIEKDENPRHMLQVSNNLVIANLLPLRCLFAPFTIFSSKVRGAKKRILDDRNIVGAEGIVSWGKDENIIAIWGALHLSGIGRLLKEAGYREVGREWLTAYHVRSYPIIEFQVGEQSEKELS